MLVLIGSIDLMVRVTKRRQRPAGGMGVEAETIKDLVDLV